MANTPTYRIVIERNGETIKKRTDDVKEAILSSKPELLFTDVYITVSKGAGKIKEVMERKLNLVQGKRLYSSEEMLEVFINNLLIS